MKPTFRSALAIFSILLGSASLLGCSTTALSGTGAARIDASTKFGNVINQSHLLFVAKLCSIVDAVQNEKKGDCLRSYNGIMQTKFDAKARAPALIDLTSIVCEQIPNNSKPSTYEFARYFCLRNAFTFAAPKDRAKDVAQCGSVTSEQDPTAKSRGDCYETAFERLTAHNQSMRSEAL